MKVILMDQIQNLGTIGDVVKVKEGYARNFLLPFGKAKRATEENIAFVEQKREELAKKSADEKTQAQVMADKLEGTRVVIQRKETNEGKLYGSVGITDIVEALNALGHEIERRHVQLIDGAFREVGEYPLVVRLHTEVEVTVTIVVEGEPEEG